MTDEPYIARALELARQAIGLASPNPRVGALVVKEGRILGEAFHTYDGVRHAEVLALERAQAYAHAKANSECARGATLYINLEPCCHTGRTGPCVQAIISAGIRRVVASMADPNPAVAGEGFRQLREAGIEVTIGAAEAAARKLNEAFAKWIRRGIPHVTLKSAITLDGKIGWPQDTAPGQEAGVNPGGRRWISGEAARAHAHELRHQADAILVGAGTILADNPLLTDRSGKPRRRPLLRVVLDSTLRAPADSRLFQTAQNDVVVFCALPDAARKRALERQGIQIEAVRASSETGVDMPEVLARLGQMEITSVLAEGGSRINRALLNAKVADKVFLYVAPRFLGEKGLPMFAGSDCLATQEFALQHISLYRFADDFAIEGYVNVSEEGHL